MDQNNNSDKTMVYTRSAADTDAGANSVAIPKSSTCTSCVGPEVSLEPGTSTYSRIFNNKNRWETISRPPPILTALGSGSQGSSCKHENMGHGDWFDI